MRFPASQPRAADCGGFILRLFSGSSCSLSIFESMGRRNVAGRSRSRHHLSDRTRSAGGSEAVHVADAAGEAGDGRSSLRCHRGRILIARRGGDRTASARQTRTVMPLREPSTRIDVAPVAHGLGSGALHAEDPVSRRHYAHRAGTAGADGAACGVGAAAAAGRGGGEAAAGRAPDTESCVDELGAAPEARIRYRDRHLRRLRREAEDHRQHRSARDHCEGPVASGQDGGG